MFHYYFVVVDDRLISIEDCKIFKIQMLFQVLFMISYILLLSHHVYLHVMSTARRQLVDEIFAYTRSFIIQAVTQIMPLVGFDVKQEFKEHHLIRDNQHESAVVLINDNTPDQQMTVDQKVLEDGKSDPSTVKSNHAMNLSNPKISQWWWSQCDQLCQDFMQQLSRVQVDFPDTVHSTSSIYIRRKQNSQFIYHIDAQMHGCTCASVFDMLADTNGRTEWDSLLAESRVVTQLDTYTRIVFVRAKAIWPTAARELYLLSHMRPLIMSECNEQVSSAQGLTTYADIASLKDISAMRIKYLNVTCSLPDTHPLSPQISPTVVRMHTPLSGQILKPTSTQDCEMVQIIDGDPKGWIPSTVVALVTTKSLPSSIRKLERLAGAKGTLTQYSRFFPREYTAVSVSDFKQVHQENTHEPAKRHFQNDAGQMQAEIEAVTPSGTQLSKSHKLHKSTGHKIDTIMQHSTPYMILGIVTIYAAKTIYTLRKK